VVKIKKRREQVIIIPYSKKSDKNYNDTGKWEINVFRNNKKKV